MIWIFLLAFIGAFFLIWKGSDWLTDSLVPVAEKLGTSYIAITTLLVSLLLSLPEIFSSVYSYVLGHLNIGLGVILGSVIMNIGLGIGVSALMKPLKVEKAVVIRDGIFMVLAAVIVLVMGSDLQYQRTEGIMLLLLFVPYALNVFAFERWRPKRSQQKKVQKIKQSLSLIGYLPWKFKPSLKTFFIGAGLLVGGSYLFSYALVGFGETLHISDLVIGLILGAIGTGIPNIAAAVQGTRKGYQDAAITETFGSNIYTLLITLGILVTLQPFAIAGRVFYFDLTWMIIMHILLLAFIFKGYHYKEESITRYEGAVLLLFYIILVVLNVIGI